MKMILVSKYFLDIEQYGEFKMSVLIFLSKSLISSRWVTNSDAIKQNESEVAEIKFLVFYIVALGIFNSTFIRKPHENWLLTS